MRVTGIEPINGKRCRVFLDGEKAFVLYKGEIRKFGILEGEDLPDGIYETITAEVLPHRAKLRALALLKNRRYTERQLLDKLTLGGYDGATAQRAIEYAKSYGYVDDEAYALDYLLANIGSHSARELEYKLMQKGIGRETFQKAMALLSQDGMDVSEDGAILALLEKKHFLDKTLDDKDKRRIYAYLSRKGFSHEAISRAFKDSLQ